VLNRPRTAVDPLGIPVGGFRVYGQLGYTGVYDSNVFATPIDTRSDYISIISPKAAIRSNWTRHALNLSAGADIGRYMDFSRQDFDDWRVASDGRLDVTSDIKIFGGGEFANLHQPRSSPDDSRGLEPTKYTSTSAFARYRHRLGRFSFAPQATFQRLDYDDVPAIRNGMLVDIDQDFRDRDEYTIELRGGYEIIPESNKLFVRVRGIDRDYDQSRAFPLGPLPGFPAEIDRSSEGYGIDAGLEFDLGGIMFGEFFAGYREQRYKSPLPDIDTPTFGVSVDWNVTRLTTVNFNVERDIKETTNAFYSGYVSTVARLTVDHELRRNLLLNASFSVADNDYVGISTPVGTAKREDTIYSAGVGAKYLLNRHLYASLGYVYLQRNSSDNTLTPGSLGRDYKIHAVFFQLETQY
jgi:hypothetical protein